MTRRKHITGPGLPRQMTKLQTNRQTNKQKKLAGKAEMEKMKDPNYMIKFQFSEAKTWTRQIWAEQFTRSSYFQSKQGKENTD